MSFYNCENCEKHYNPEESHTYIFPSGSEEHFCSLKCLKEWLLKLGD